MKSNIDYIHTDPELDR